MERTITAAITIRSPGIGKKDDRTYRLDKRNPGTNLAITIRSPGIGKKDDRTYRLDKRNPGTNIASVGTSKQSERLP